MNRFTLAVVASIAATASAQAGSLDRAGNNIDVLFEEGDYAEISFGYVDPSVDGTDLALFGGSDTGNVADSYFQAGLGYKQQLSDQVSFALVMDQPYGADIDYGPDSVALGGTRARVDTTSLSATARYEFDENWSVHGGLRAQHLNASVSLSGAAYGALSGYEGRFDGDTAVGWQVGASYEIPEIALRVTATYFSKIDHDVDVREQANIPPIAGAGFVETDDIEITTPEALNISFQTGIAADTLLFGSFRFADYRDATVSPVFFNGVLATNPFNPSTGNSLTNIDIVRDFSIGVGRRFTDQFSGSVELLYSDGGPDDLVSPLSPTDGSYGVTLGGRYDVTEAVSISGGVNYTWLGDADAETGTPDTARAEFRDNDFVGVGLKLAYSF